MKFGSAARLSLYIAGGIIILSLLAFLYLKSESEKIEKFFAVSEIVDRCGNDSFLFYSQFKTNFIENDEGLFITTPDHIVVSITMNSEASKNYRKIPKDTNYLTYYSKNKLLLLDGWRLINRNCAGTRSNLFFVRNLNSVERSN